MSIQKPRKPLTEEQKARRKEYKKAWNAANKEKVAAYNREWIEKNPDRARESRRLWAVKNPEKISEKDSKYRANNAEKLRELSKTNYEKIKKRSPCIIKRDMCFIEMNFGEKRRMEIRKPREGAAFLYK